MKCRVISALYDIYETRRETVYCAANRNESINLARIPGVGVVTGTDHVVVYAVTTSIFALTEGVCRHVQCAIAQNVRTAHTA